MTKSHLSLSQYLSTVQEVIKLAFDDPVWVRAEIRNLSIQGGQVILPRKYFLYDFLNCLMSFIAICYQATKGKFYVYSN